MRAVEHFLAWVRAGYLASREQPASPAEQAEHTDQVVGRSVADGIASHEDREAG